MGLDETAMQYLRELADMENRAIKQGQSVVGVYSWCLDTIERLQARLESEEAHYCRLVEQQEAILDEAIEWIQDECPFSIEQILESLNG